MKKIGLAILLATASATASAANFVSVDVERVKDRVTGDISQAQYVRAGKDFGNFNLGLQSRTATPDSGGLVNSFETTAGIKAGMFNPFVGVGYDNGFNGAKGASYTYGLIGATVGHKMGPGFALVGAKSRVNWDENNPKQTLVFGTYSIPLTKAVAFNLNASRSYQTFKEDSYGAGLTFRF